MVGLVWLLHMKGVEYPRAIILHQAHAIGIIVCIVILFH